MDTRGQKDDSAPGGEGPGAVKKSGPGTSDVEVQEAETKTPFEQAVEQYEADKKQRDQTFKTASEKAEATVAAKRSRNPKQAAKAAAKDPAVIKGMEDITDRRRQGGNPGPHPPRS